MEIHLRRSTHESRESTEDLDGGSKVKLVYGKGEKMKEQNVGNLHACVLVMLLDFPR